MLKNVLFFLLICPSFSWVYAQPGSQTVIPCPAGSLTTTLPNSGFSGDNPTSAAGSCGQCCYTGSDLDGDGDQDVSYSVENSKWFKWCNTSGASITTSFTVNETNNNCNLQGAIFVGSSAGPQNALDGLDTDCSNSEFNEFGSNVSGNADGFSFSNVTIANNQCAYIMVDGYGGAACPDGFTISTPACIACTLPTTMTAGSDITICEGSSGALNSTVSGGTVDGSISYSWSPTTGLSCSTCADPTANPTSTTTYTLTACNSFTGTACCRTDAVVVTVTPSFIPNAGTDVTSCAPSTVTIGGAPTGPAGSTYSWAETTANAGIAISGSSTVANPSVAISGGATGSATYTVTVTNGACIRTDLVVVTVGTLAVNAGLDIDLCVGSSITIGGSPTAPAGSTYSWAETGANANVAISSATNIANPTVTVSTGATGTATYTVTATLSGCSNTDAVIVNVRPLPTTPTATPSASPICAGASSLLTAAGGAGAGTYTWWDAATAGTQLSVANTFSVTPTTTTTYYIQSTDATFGCVSARGSVTVTVTPTPVANAGADAERCAGNAIALSGSITNPGACAPAQTWSIISGTGTFSNANSLTSSFTPSSTGTITLRLTPCSPGGCAPVTDDLVLTINPSPTVDATMVSDTLCPGLATDLSAVASGGTPAPDVVTTNNFTSGTGPFAIPENNVNGVVIPISVTGVPNTTLGLSDIAGVNVNVSHTRIGHVEVWICPPGIATVSPYTGCLQLFNNHGGNGDNMTNTLFSDAGTTDIASGVVPYTGTFNATGSNVLTSLDGQATNGTWNLVVLDNVSASGTTGTAGQWGLNFSTPTPNPNPYTYAWSAALGISDVTSSAPTLFSTGFTAPATITKTVTVTDDNGCTATDVVSIVLLAPPTAILDGSTVDLCSTASGIGSDNTNIAVNLSGISAWTFTPVYSGTNEPVVNTTSDPYNMNVTYAEVSAMPGQTMTVTVASVSDKYCNGTSSGNFTVTAFCVLPINLISFTGEKLDRGSNLLSWNVGSENQNDYFYLEKSTDGVNFDFLNKTYSKVGGNSSQLVEYEFIDDKVSNTKNFYRLFQVDYNGSTNQLETILIDESLKSKIEIIPNPFEDYVNILVYEKGTYFISIKDISSKKVFETSQECEKGKNEIIANLSNLKNGVYIVQIEVNSKIQNLKIIKTE